MTRTAIGALALWSLVGAGCIDTLDGGEPDIGSAELALSMTSKAQVDQATLHANYGGYAYARNGTSYSGTDGTGRVSWKQGGFTMSGAGEVSTCTYGWCGPGSSLAGTRGGCVPGDDYETAWGYAYGACNSSAWGQRFAGWLDMVDRPVGSGDHVHADYGPGVSGTTTFGYHPYWAVIYDGVCRIYQGWSYTTHDETCGSSPYVVTTPAVCGDGTCASTESCSTCQNDCGVCPTGIYQTGLAGGTLTRQLVVPSNGDVVTIKIYNGTGDCDLHVKKNAAVSTSSYDCRPYKSGNTETCSFTGGGTYNILLNPYSAYSGMTLDASYTTTAPVVCGDAVCNGAGGETCSSCASDCGACPTGINATNLSVAASAWTTVYTLTASNPTFRMFGGSGDADLYVRLGAAPTTSSYNCRPYLSGNTETCTMSGSGTWYVAARGYTAASGFTITSQ